MDSTSGQLRQRRAGKSSASRPVVQTKSIVKVLSYCLKKLFKPEEPTESWVTFVLWIISISIDPLIYYLPVINDEKKYLEINNKLVVLLLVIIVVLQSCGFVVKSANVLTLFTFALRCLLVNSMVSVDATVFFIAIYFFLVLHSWRIYGIYGLYAYKVTRTRAEEAAKITMIKIVLNLVLYMYGGYVFGGTWYLFAIRKKTECWKKACSDHSGCHLDFNLGFIVASGDTKFLNDDCPMVLNLNGNCRTVLLDRRELESCRLGMFNDAFEFGIVESKNFPRKLFLCFRWGIQNLSGIGLNLPASGHIAENIFVIFIIIYGVIMFTYFLGNVQMFIKHATKASNKRRETIREEQEREIKKWPHFRKLTKGLRDGILENHNYRRVKPVHIKNMIKNVPTDIQNNIKRELCSGLLKKVGNFGSWDAASLFDLCDRVKPMVYKQGTCIAREGELISGKTWLVLQGKVHTSSPNKRTTADRTDNLFSDDSKNLFEDGDFWGEEFVNRIQNDPSSSRGSLVSNRKITALTMVETFVLRASDLRNFYLENVEVIKPCFPQRSATPNETNIQMSTGEQRRRSQELPRPDIAADQGTSSAPETFVEGNSPVSEIVEERHQ